MTIPIILDFDKIAAIVLMDIREACKGWLSGQPTDEVALMNRITANLNRRRRGCDVGVGSPVHMESQLAMLHRKGPKQTDLYGADLAITILVLSLNLVKTSFFQFKKSNRFKASLVRKQIDAALSDPRVADRSFAMAVDEVRFGIRLKEVRKLRSEFQVNQQSRSFDTSDWAFLTEWLWNWLSCDIGPPSDLGSPDSVEILLQRYVSNDDWKTPWISAGDDNLADDYLPARAWLVLSLIETETSSPEFKGQPPLF